MKKITALQKLDQSLLKLNFWYELSPDVAQYHQNLNAITAEFEQDRKTCVHRFYRRYPNFEYETCKKCNIQRRVYR